MKIIFDTPAEAHQIADIIRKHIFPNPLILDTHDLAAACSSEDLPLPWQEDGFHIPVTVRHNRSGRKPRKARARMSEYSPRVSFTAEIDLADLEKGELKW